MGKAKQKITNWSEYNQGLVKRGSVTFWINKETIKSWYCKTHHGRHGRGYRFSDHAIQTALAIKVILGFSFRALKGFLNSIFELMALDVKSPNYTCISKRAKTVEVAYRLPAKGPVMHLAIHATGLKVFSEGEWKVKKHSAEKRRV